MKLKIFMVKVRKPWRFCKHMPNPMDHPATKMIWAELKVNGDGVVARCSRCMYELCEFSPMWGRVLNKDHACEICGKTGVVVKFMSNIPYPGVKKIVCVDCFIAVGVEKAIDNNEGVVVDN